MSGKHTPGPWTSQGRYVGVPSHMSFIAECRDQNGNWSNDPMSVSNARLIAAAPDLLEALRTAKETIRALHGPVAWEIYDGQSPEMKAINAAIALATGEQGQ